MVAILDTIREWKSGPDRKRRVGQNKEMGFVYVKDHNQKPKHLQGLG